MQRGDAAMTTPLAEGSLLFADLSASAASVISGALQSNDAAVSVVSAAPHGNNINAQGGGGGITHAAVLQLSLIHI